MKENKKIKSLTRVKGKYAYLFILPFLFGFIFMFAVPMAQSAWFSLCKVGINRNGFVTAFNGIGNYNDALLSDVFFRQRVVESVLNMLLNVPLILVFSFFMANVLNINVNIIESEEGPGLGGAMLAAVACGEYASVQEAADKIVKVVGTEKPDPVLAAKYDERYGKFKEIYPTVKALYDTMKA